MEKGELVHQSKLSIDNDLMVVSEYMLQPLRVMVNLFYSNYPLDSAIFSMLKQPLKQLASILNTSAIMGAKLTKDKRELDHVVKILRAASKGAKKNQLFHRCDLTKPTFGKYVAALAELDLLEAKDAPETYYKTTDKGLELLHTYHKLRWLLWRGNFDFMLVGLLGRLKMDRKEREKYNAYIT